MSFLVFIDDADDAATYPVSSFVGMTVAADATIVMRFLPSFNPVGAADGDVDTVTLTCTADTEKDVMLAIAKQVERGGTLLVADDVNSVYCHKDITACAITLGS